MKARGVFGGLLLVTLMAATIPSCGGIVKTEKPLIDDGAKGFTCEHMLLEEKHSNGLQGSLSSDGRSAVVIPDEGEGFQVSISGSGEIARTGPALGIPPGKKTRNGVVFFHDCSGTYCAIHAHAPGWSESLAMTGQDMRRLMVGLKESSQEVIYRSRQDDSHAYIASRYDFSSDRTLVTFTGPAANETLSPSGRFLALSISTPYEGVREIHVVDVAQGKKFKDAVVGSTYRMIGVTDEHVLFEESGGDTDYWPVAAQPITGGPFKVVLDNALKTDTIYPLADGKVLARRTKEYDYGETYRYDTEMILLDPATGEARLLFRDLHGESQPTITSVATDTGDFLYSYYFTADDGKDTSRLCLARCPDCVDAEKAKAFHAANEHQDKQDYAENLRKLGLALAAKDPAEKAKQLETLLGDDPSFDNPHIMPLAEAYLATGQPEKAERLLLMYTAGRPVDHVGHQRLCQALDAQKRPADAWPSCKMATSIETDFKNYEPEFEMQWSRIAYAWALDRLTKDPKAAGHLLDALVQGRKAFVDKHMDFWLALAEGRTHVSDKTMSCRALLEFEHRTKDSGMQPAQKSKVAALKAKLDDCAGVKRAPTTAEAHPGVDFKAEIAKTEAAIKMGQDMLRDMGATEEEIDETEKPPDPSLSIAQSLDKHGKEIDAQALELQSSREMGAVNKLSEGMRTEMAKPRIEQACSHDPPDAGLLAAALFVVKTPVLPFEMASKYYDSDKLAAAEALLAATAAKFNKAPRVQALLCEVRAEFGRHAEAWPACREAITLESDLKKLGPGFGQLACEVLAQASAEDQRKDAGLKAKLGCK